MKTYLVGGAVRDKLLGLPIRECDYVVIGATPELMISQGFMPVGRDFPVFLHPKTHEEYALARTERKIARGHQGFSFYADPNVTLEEDLKRRDLTVNAIAEDPDTQALIDPYHGQADLEKHILRHVSDAFVEDPLRILRVARFCAFLGAFDFSIAPETLALMRTMVKENALAELSDERIWKEVYRALETDYPELFFDTLNEVGALASVFADFHKEARIALMRAKELSSSPLIRFAALSHQAAYIGAHPKDFEDLAEMVREQGKIAATFAGLGVEEKVQFLRSLDYLRRPERFADWILACKAAYPNFAGFKIEKAAELLRNIDRKTIAAQAMDPTDIPHLIFKAECNALSKDFSG